MTVGEKIKRRRLELGWSQDELAKKCGYKSRSSINKIELARDLPLKKIEVMADALEVTPGYLMGWEPDEQTARLAHYSEKWAEMILDPKVRELVRGFCKLPSQRQAIVLNLVRSLQLDEHP